MARSKNRIADVRFTEPHGPLYITAQVELPDGQVVSGHFKLTCWRQPPKAVEQLARDVFAPREGPIGIAGRVSKGSTRPR
jgi:hypothetical protein